MQVTQQCRPEDIEAVRARYAALGIPADLSTYIADMSARLGWSHLVIARSGASTVAELTTVGRPAILVPYPSATDDHQTANAREMVKAGGARSIPQSQFTPIELAKQMQKLALDAPALTNAARHARNVGRPDAAERLADLVESLGQMPVMDAIGDTAPQMGGLKGAYA
jgi:UDP-N-acetylglucosamine--N-acetylmuramyl-(pentapeptide) pyrophosphoryl-undecaprenol N-acetylglucosamine transferase